MPYRIAIYLRVDVEPEEDTLYDTRAEAEEEARHLESFTDCMDVPPTLCRVIEVDEPTKPEGPCCTQRSM